MEIGGSSDSSDSMSMEIGDESFLNLKSAFAEFFTANGFDDSLPSGDGLLLGVNSLLNPDLVATITESCEFEGHPFLVEVVVSIGGKGVNKGLNIFHFANRDGDDVVTRTIRKRIDWESFVIDKNEDKIGVFVRNVSKPFKGIGKEYIGYHSQMASAVKSAIQQCCVQLRNQFLEQQERRYMEYIPDMSNSIFNVLRRMALEHIEKGAYLKGVDDLLDSVVNGTFTVETIENTYIKCFEKPDDEMELELVEYATLTGASEEPKDTVHESKKEIDEDKKRTEAVKKDDFKEEKKEQETEIKVDGSEDNTEDMKTTDDVQENMEERDEDKRSTEEGNIEKETIEEEKEEPETEMMEEEKLSTEEDKIDDKADGSEDKTGGVEENNEEKESTNEKKRKNDAQESKKEGKSGDKRKQRSRKRRL